MLRCRSCASFPPASPGGLIEALYRRRTLTAPRRFRRLPPAASLKPESSIAAGNAAPDVSAGFPRRPH